MPTLSQIAAASGAPAPADRFVGVTAANADILWTYMQAAATPPNTQTGTTYTLVLSDFNGVVERNNASANTLTIPLNASVAFPVGTVIFVTQLGVGQTTIAATAGVTTRAPFGLAIGGQFHLATLYQRAANDWYVWVN